MAENVAESFDRFAPLRIKEYRFFIVARFFLHHGAAHGSYGCCLPVISIN